MNEILELLMVIKWCANDVHYTSTGSKFYAEHLLADKVSDFGSAEDDIKECYYLGQLRSAPPADRDIATQAISRYDDLCINNDRAIFRLYHALRMLMFTVENLSKDTSFAKGVYAILDDISLKALRYSFLVDAQSDMEINNVENTENN